MPNGDAQIVRELGELYATGEWSVLRLAQRFNLNRFAVEEMLSCRVYQGEIECAGEIFAGQHEPLWSAELWERIQAVRELRGRRRTRAPRTHDPLLVGLIYCAACGAARWHSFSNERRYDECSTRATGRPGPIADLTCCAVRSRAEVVEQSVLALVGSLAYMPDIIADVQAALQHRAPAARATNQSAIDRLKQRFMRDEISASEYERVRQELQQAPTAAPITGPDPAVALSLLSNLPELLRAATPSEIRPVLRELISEVYTARREVVGIRPTQLGEALLGAAADQPEEWFKSACWWAGRGSNPRPSV